MLKKEAHWLSQKIYSLPTEEVFPMLNIGSSTQEMRQRIQPWIESEIFEVASKCNYPVIHTDIKEDHGVDVVGDLRDSAFVERLMELKIKSVLCANLLEHLTEPLEICDAISKTLIDGGYLFLTVPYKYPFHPDPIDTMLRPSVEELSQCFSGFEVVFGEVVDCGMCFQQDRSWFHLLKNIIRLAFPFYKPKSWLLIVANSLPWYFRDVSVTCIVLKKKVS